MYGISTRKEFQQELECSHTINQNKDGKAYETNSDEGPTEYSSINCRFKHPNQQIDG
jgi:hypothetical protein